MPQDPPIREVSNDQKSYCGSDAEQGSVCWFRGPQDPAETWERYLVSHDSDNPRLDALRRFRDDILAGSLYGRKLIDLYYRNENSLKAIILKRPAMRAVAKRVFEALSASPGPNR